MSTATAKAVDPVTVEIIRNGLLAYLVRRLIGEGRREYEHDLVLGGTAPREDVLQHARQPHSGECLPDFLLELAVHRVPRVFAELDMTAERPVKHLPGRARFLRYQQRTVARPLDHRHCLDDLAPGFHPVVVSHRTRAGGPAWTAPFLAGCAAEAPVVGLVCGHQPGCRAGAGGTA